MAHPSGANYKYSPTWLDRAKRAEGGATDGDSSQSSSQQSQPNQSKADNLANEVETVEFLSNQGD